MKVCFESLFSESGGKPVAYKGKQIQLMDRFPVKNESEIKIIFESMKADWRQGIHLSTNGHFEVNGQVIKNVALWQDTAPREVTVTIKSKSEDCVIKIKNIWDIGDGVMQFWHNGAAMIVETCEGGRRYRCNDGRPDDDFDDLIVRIQTEGSVK